MSSPSRRTLLRIAVAGPLTLLAGAASGCGEPGGTPPTTSPGAEQAGIAVTSGTFRTPRRPGVEVAWTLSRPPTVKGLIVALHGKDGRGSDWFGDIAAQRAAAAAQLAIVGVDGAGLYWHARRDGSDAGAMIDADLLPLMAAQGLPVARIGLLGLSMGGFGALLLGSRLGPGRIFGVATMSAALWSDPGRTAPGAFDDRDDYDRVDVFARVAALKPLRIWMACGDRDPFRADNELMAKRLGNATTVFDGGGHTVEYWRDHVGAALSFLAAGA